MKKFAKTLYWIGYIAVNLLAYNLFALIIVMSLALPENLLSGFFAWSLIICMMLFAADDATLAKFKDLFVRKDGDGNG